jgi:hypothetical protein
VRKVSIYVFYTTTIRVVEAFSIASLPRNLQMMRFVYMLTNSKAGDLANPWQATGALPFMIGAAVP